MPRYRDWNTALLQSVESFASEHPDITALLFSSHATFTRILDDPVKHGFLEPEAEKTGGKGIWMDFLHPMGAVHDIVAKELGEFLGAVVQERILNA